MMNPKTPMNSWILEKIMTFLTTKEGCETADLEYTAQGAKTIVQDVFGYRYEISVKTLSRIDNSSEGFDKYAMDNKIALSTMVSVQKS